MSQWQTTGGYITRACFISARMDDVCYRLICIVMPRPILATIHPQAIRHNLERVRKAAPDAQLMSMVKANAYGHGLEHAFAGLRATDGFAVLEVAEAQRLRALDWRGPILLIEGVFDARDLEMCSRLGLWHTVHCDQQIDWLAAHKTQVPHRVFLKMNSGMNRLGFTPERFRSAYARLNALPQVEEISFITHFSDADGPRGTAHQQAVFARVTDDLPGERTLCNSAAALLQGMQEKLRGDWVRPGIVLFGSSPDYPAHTAADWDLRPAMTLSAQIIGTQYLHPGDTVGYGSTFSATQPTHVGVVACGYADGYPRLCGTGTPVLVNGVRTRLLGRVSMDMLCVDLTPVPGAGFGSEVVLWGQSPSTGAVLSIDEVAAAAGTTGYELMCAVAPRVPVVSDEEMVRK